MVVADALGLLSTQTIPSGFTLPTLTTGSVLFSDGTTIAQDNANFFWDDVNNRLGINTNTPAYGVDIAGAAGAASSIRTGWGVYSRYIINPTATGTYIEFQPSVHQMQFTINGTEAIRIPSTRNVLIGTTTDGGARLQVKSSAINTDVISLLNTANASLFRVFNGGSGQAIVDIGGTVFLRSDAALSYINSGNFAIGTTTDAGYKLDVNGTTRLNGLSSINGAGVANTALAVYGNGNGGGNYLFRMYDASAVERFYLTASGNFRLNGATDTSTTGTDEKWRMVLNFAPTSGTRQHNGIYLTQTINQTGGANGVTRGLLIEPTLTAAADYRAIETTNGRIVIADTATVTGSNATSLLDLSQTWNTTGAPIAIKLNITDTASATLSDLISLQVGGSARFRVLKSGYFVHNTGGEINGNLVVGGSLLNVSAVLDVQSTTRGFLPPRMTTTQKNAIATPAPGLVVYDSTDNKHYGFDGSAWYSFQTDYSILGLQNALSTDSLLTNDNTIDGGGNMLLFDNLAKTAFNSNAFVDINVDSGTHQARVLTTVFGGGLATVNLYANDASGTTGIDVVSTGINIKTFSVATKTAGDVLTLVDPLTGEVEYATPSGGGGGVTALESIINALIFG